MLIDLVEDYLDFANDTWQVDPELLDYRIGELQGERDELESGGDELDPDAALELRMLLKFKAEVERITGSDLAYSTLVPEAVFEKHVRYYAEQEYGVDADSMGDYVDWERYARDQRKDFTSVVVDDQEVWVQ